MQDLDTRRFTRAANGVMLAVCIGLISGNLLLPLSIGTQDLLRYYTAAALLLELLLLYVPGQRICAAMAHAGRPVMARRLQGTELFLSIMLGISLLFLSTGINSLFITAWEGLGLPSMQSVMPSEGGWRLIAAILVIGVIPAYAEETFFRGALLSAWLPLGEKRALWRTTLLFSLFHFQPLSLPSLLIISLMLGKAALLTRSVRSPMAIHTANNVLAVLISYGALKALGGAEPMPLTLLEMLPSIALYLATGAAGCAITWKALKRATTAAQSAEAEACAAPAAAQGAPQRAPLPAYRPGERELKGSGKPALVLTYILLCGLNVLVLYALLFQDSLLGALGVS